MHSRTSQPVLYAPAVETVSDDEADVIAELRETMLGMSATLHEHTDHAMRCVHAKSFGRLRGTLEVLPGMPSALSQGLLSAPRSYDLVARLQGSEGDTTQDVLMVDGPVFAARNARDFLRQVKLLAPTTDAPLGVDLANHPDGLREAIVQFFAADAAEWELLVQLNTDLEKIPIEDASAPWSEEESPHLPVARLRIANQSAWHGQRSPCIEGRLAFNPWHGPEVPRPLGGVIRACREVYPSSVGFHANANGCPIHEPPGLAEMDARAEA